MKLLYLIPVLCSMIALSASAQESKETPKTLFPYPTVSDTIQTLENRSNFFITHFWDKANLSSQITDIEGFEKAFNDYITFFRFAHKNVVRSSISDLMNKAQSNMKNFWLIAQTAEKYLYSDEASLKSDEAYALFINNILRSSNIKKKEKAYYQKQLIKINSNQVGSSAPDFKATDLDGNKWELNELNTDSAATVILFFTPIDCADCGIPRLRISTDINLNRMIENGEVIFINVNVGKYSKEWAEKAREYSHGWIILASEDVNDIYNIPSDDHTIYLLSGEKIIQNRNINADILLNAVN